MIRARQGFQSVASLFAIRAELLSAKFSFGSFLLRTRGRIQSRNSTIFCSWLLAFVFPPHMCTRLDYLHGYEMSYSSYGLCTQKTRQNNALLVRQDAARRWGQRWLYTMPLTTTTPKPASECELHLARGRNSKSRFAHFGGLKHPRGV